MLMLTNDFIIIIFSLVRGQVDSNLLTFWFNIYFILRLNYIYVGVSI